jgi:heptose-I-phosphate ethanolaminephosphotransferase
MGRGKFDNNTDRVPAGLSNDELEAYNDYDSAECLQRSYIASLIKDQRPIRTAFPLYFSIHGEEVYDTPPHKTQGRNEDNPTRHMYTVPFRTLKNGRPRTRATSQDVNRKYSSSELIHTWSDLAGLHLRWLRSNSRHYQSAVQRDNPLDWQSVQENALIDYDSALRRSNR